MGVAASTANPELPDHGGVIRILTPHRSASLGASTTVTELPDHGDAQARPPIYPIRSASMGAGALTLLSELVDKQQAKAAAGDRFDEAAFDAAAVDGRVPSALLMEISSWLQALRDGTTKLDLTGPTQLGTAGSRERGTMLIYARSAARRVLLPRLRGPFEL